MRDTHGFASLSLVMLAATAAALPFGARADVTVQERSTFDLAVIKAHGNTTELTTADKQRRSTDLHCEGFMSMVCGNTQSEEIIRLDRDVRWALDPAKKQYQETPILSGADRQAAEQRARAMMEKMKQCPAAQSSPSAPDTAKCEMTPPVVDLKPTDQHASIAGHDAKLTQIALTQSCRNKDTGDVCDFVLTLDSWLTQDQIAGLEDRRAFQSAYQHKLGFDETTATAQKQMRQFLAPYAESLKQLSGRAGDLQGYPLKSAFRVSFGGEHCAAAAKAQSAAAGGGSVVANAGQAAGAAAADSAASAAGTEAAAAASKAAGNSAGSAVLGKAAGAFGNKLVGGLFAKKKAEAPAAPAASTSAHNMIQAVEVTVETTSITPGAVPATQFDIPPGWKQVVPKEEKPKEFSCPNSGS